jgi:type IV secretion system protein VirB8
MAEQNTIPAAVAPGREQKYFEKARDWEADRQSRLERSERRAWVVAGAASVVAVVAVLGIATLAPFKRVVPMVFAVDKASGNTELVNAADDRNVAQLGYQELLDKHWASQYIIARESYFYRLLQTDYNTVLMLSADDVGRDYARLFEGTDPRDKKLGSQTEWKVTVLSVSLQHDGVGSKAVVRFQREERKNGAERPEPPSFFVATMAYEYKPSMFGKEKDLVQNPLGYRVTSYRLDSELAPMPSVAAVASATPN